MKLNDILTMADWFFYCDDIEKKAKIKSAFLGMAERSSVDFSQEKRAMERFELRCQHLSTCRRLDRISGR